jgi:hypothetical protein
LCNKTTLITLSFTHQVDLDANIKTIVPGSADNSRKFGLCYSKPSSTIENLYVATDDTGDSQVYAISLITGARKNLFQMGNRFQSLDYMAGVGSLVGHPWGRDILFAGTSKLRSLFCEQNPIFLFS